jgi:hypothetical protein
MGGNGRRASDACFAAGARNRSAATQRQGQLTPAAACCGSVVDFSAGPRTVHRRLARTAQHAALWALNSIALLLSSRYYIPSSHANCDIPIARQTPSEPVRAQTRCPARSSTPPLQPRLLSSTHTCRTSTAPPRAVFHSFQPAFGPIVIWCIPSFSLRLKRPTPAAPIRTRHTPWPRHPLP